MYLHHQQIVVANRRDHPAALSPAVNRHELANLIAMPNPCAGPLPAILQILRRDSHRRVRKENIVLADGQRPFHHHMRLHHGAGADLHVRTNNTIRSDVGRLRDFRRGVDNGSRMYGHRYWRSASTHRISASATTTPSTVAVPDTFAMVA